MNDSVVILGRQPALGIAELESLYGGDNVVPIGDSAALLHIAPCSIDFARLGGAIRLCKMLTELDTTNWKQIEKFLLQVSPGHASTMPEGKMHLGLSVYGLDISPQHLLATGLNIKKAIQKGSGRSVRLVPNKTTELNTAQVIHNKLTGRNGWELVFVKNGDAKKIRAHEHRQERAGGIAGGQDDGEKCDAEDAESGKAGLGHADEKCGERQQGPLPGVEMHGRG